MLITDLPAVDAIHLRMDSVQDALHVVSSPANASATYADVFNPDKKDSHGYGSSWYGLPTLQETLAVIHGRGWEDGAARVQSMFGEIQNFGIEAPRSIRRRKTWAEDGDTCDPNRLKSGQYDKAFQTTTRRPRTTAGKSVRIFCNIGGTADITSTQMFNSGAAALFLTDALEAAGYRVELHATNQNSGIYGYGTKSPSLIVTCKIKSADEPANVDALASTLCLTGFFRTVFFHAFEALPRQISSGYGTSQQLTTEKLEATELYERGDIVIPMLRTKEAAAAFIRKTFGEMNGEGTDTTESGDYEDDGAHEYTPPAYTPPAPVETRKIRATGRGTYPNRLTLKQHGFTFNKEFKSWDAPANVLDAHTLMKTGIEGVTFTEV